MKIKPGRWTLICIAGLAGGEIVSEWIRPVYGKGDGIIPFLLGVAPSFMAAALVIPFANLMFLENTDKQPALKERHWFYVGLVISQIGLIGWEFMQLTGKLYFDWNDIAAIFLGGGTAILIFEKSKSEKWSNSPPPSAT